MAPFVRKKSAGSTTPSSSSSKNHGANNKTMPPNDASSSSMTTPSTAAVAPPESSSAKKPSKIKRLFTSAASRRKKNGISASVIIPAASLALEGDRTLPHSNAEKKPSGNNKQKQQQPIRIPSKKQPPPSLREIATLLQSDIEVRDRKYHFKIYKKCFVGSELVDYLVENDLAHSRSEAATMAQEIMVTLKLFEHVQNTRSDFEDDYQFYRFIRAKDASAVETVPNYRRLASDGDGSRGSSSGNDGGIIKMDKYGFLLDDDRCSANGGGADCGNNDLVKLRSSDAKRWESILDKVPKQSSLHQSATNLSHSTTQSKVKSYARRGLPDSLRQKAWTVLTGVDLIMNENPGEYDELVNRAEEEYRKMHDHESGDLSLNSVCGDGGGGSSNNNKVINVLETIERDIHRTFPKHYLFHSGFGEDDDENDHGGNNKMGDSQISEGLYDSENVGTDDEYENGDGDSIAGSDADDIVEIAESTGQDPALVVEAKKQLFNESMNTLMNISCGIGCTARADSVDDKGGDHTDKTSFNADGTSNNSDKSLDIFDDEESDDDPNEVAGRRISAQSLTTSSEALGMGGGQGALRRVLRAYSMYDSEVGYCQGMNFITAMFLTFLSEEEAFWLLVVVMNEEPYKLRELFGEDMAGTHEVLYIAEKLLAQFLPKLSKHFEEENIHVSMFVIQWLLTVYTSTFPFDLVARVWDCFLVEGWKVVYRVMLSLLEHASKDILDFQFEQILNYFRDFPSTVNGQAIMAGSLKIALKRKHIQKHVNEWRRHAGAGGEERSKKSLSMKLKRRNSGGSSVPSNTMNSVGHDLSFPKLAPSRIFLKNQVVPREIVVENLSDQLLPIIGSYKFAVMLHSVLTPEECSELIDRAEENGFEDASIYDRRTNKAHRDCKRCVIDDLSLAGNWYERISDALKDTPFERRLMTAPWINTRNTGNVHRAVGINERLRLLKYRQGQFFHSHNDAVFVRGSDSGERAGETSSLSAHIYLNQKFKGGFTTFHGKGRHLDVKPKTGSILLFEHNILHEGQKVTHGKKYVVRADIMYSTTNVGFTSAASGTTITQQL
mmetsp:Transcript_3009/g.6562  ORF Transcript_3009/g.6562 Transcript_3009/m.6562 type:complete len:1062 (-) Transcript_3009:140-3325(-)